jgi:hypothetical protein
MFMLGPFVYPNSCNLRRYHAQALKVTPEKTSIGSEQCIGLGERVSAN